MMRGSSGTTAILVVTFLTTLALSWPILTLGDRNNEDASTSCMPGSYYDSRSGLCLECPAGRYGSLSGLQSKECSGSCQMGCFCKRGSIQPCEEKCPSGRFGQSKGLATEACSGLTEPGCYGEAGATSSCPYTCGSVNMYCPEGANTPTAVSTGFYTLNEPPFGFLPGDVINESLRRRLLFPYAGRRSSQVECEKGHYCVGGRRYPCAAGRYGDSRRLSSEECSGECPLGSFCPEASEVPTLCPAGRYGGVQGLQTPLCSGRCSKGYFCPKGSSSVTQVPCQSGRYGVVEGLASLECNANCTQAITGRVEVIGKCKPTACKAGYFCPEASTSPEQNSCGSPAVYCPLGSGAPTPASKGYFTVGRDNDDESDQSAATRVAERICPVGSYCIDGVRHLCPGGRYGSTRGLSSSECSGPAEGGTFTLPGAYSRYPDGNKTQTCGSASVFCPPGSSVPLDVGRGNYSIQGTGYDRRAGQAVCEPGYFCADGVRRRCAEGFFGSSPGLVSPSCSAPCNLGQYCPRGSVAGIDCPGGTYGDTRGLHEAACSGPCRKGYYCPEGTFEMQRCGSDDVYCPAGSSAPIPVDPGYYSVGGSAMTREGQVKCEVETDAEGRCPTRLQT